ncbi:MAG: WD40 repeat domain-containing protein [Scytonema sp. CRU_2_7]|nr:WD40 repeat domain-containing protein [Scytonema sp. CRU_2_7]
MKAGLLPELYGGGMIRAGSRWRVALLRPGNAPINTLAKVLNEHNVLGNELGEYSSKQFSILFTETMLRRGRLGLIETVEYAELPTDVNLLVVIDQFEEIFRYKATHQQTNAADESAAFVKLLLEAIKTEQPPIYILLTMRSDYLGECSQFEGLAEEINQSHYLVPRMTRDQLREAILGPITVASARVGGANITPQLLNRLLNDVGDDPDQLPILQHALMRTWNNWMQDESAASLDKSIDLKHYINIGSMREALSQHGDEIYNELSPLQKEIAKTLFKCLTTKEDGRYIRRHTKLETICAIVKASKEDVTEEHVLQVIEQFRREGRSFLMPYTGEINSKDVIDISHESLIRVWQKLKDWSDEEAEKAEDYHRLVEDWKFKKDGKGGFLRDRQLAVALKWRDKYNPHEAWAAMYADKSGNAIDFNAVMRFLEDSEEKDEKEKAQKERQQQEKIRIRNLIIAIITILLICVLGSFVFALWWAREAKKSELKAISSSARASFASDQQLEALIESLKVGRELKQWYSQTIDSETKLQVLAVLREMVYKVNERNRLEKDTYWVRCLSFTKDGKLLASGSKDKTIKLWRRDGRLFKNMDNKSPVKSLAFSPDGEVLVSGDDENTIKLWSIHKTHPIMELPKQEGLVTSVDFSPDGKRFVSASERIITLWERNGKLIKKFPNLHTALVNSVKFIDNNTIASGSNDKTIKIWRIDGKEIASRKDSNQVVDIAFNPKRQLIASASGDEIKLWSRDGKQQGEPLKKTRRTP